MYLGVKRIVLTDEQKKEYELKINVLKAKRFATPKEQRRGKCPNCRDRFNLEHATRCKHPGYCCDECAQGIKKEKKPKNFKKAINRRLRQDRRQRRLDKVKKGIDVFYSSRKWRDLRFKALRLYGFKCMACGMTAADGVKLHVDHIKPRSRFPHLELSLENLQVLCEDCNLGKSNKSEDDLRPKE